MGWRYQENLEQAERRRYYAETTWRQRAADRLRVALILGVPVAVIAAVYWIAHGG